MEGNRKRQRLKMRMVHIQISIRAGFGSVKLPSSKLKSERLTEVFAQNGVKSSDTIPIYETIGIDPETQEETMLSPAWAKFKLMNDLQNIQETYMVSLGEAGGFEVASADFPAVEQKIAEMVERCEALKEVLTEPEYWNAAEDLFISRVNNIFDALIVESELERDRLIALDATAYDEACNAHQKRVNSYELDRRKMLNKFPSIEEFLQKFRVTNSEPVVKASLLEKLQGDTEAMKALAEEQIANSDLEFANALKSARERALQDYLSAIKDQMDGLQNELLDKHILPVLKTLDDLDTKKVSKTAQKAFDKHLERAEKILNLLSGMSGTAIDAGIADAETTENQLDSLQALREETAKLRAAFESSNPKAREDVQAQLAAFKASLRESVIVAQQGGTSLAEWCMIDDAAEATAEAAPQIAEVMLDEVVTVEESAPIISNDSLILDDVVGPTNEPAPVLVGAGLMI